ncbi:sensor histidine kinase [Aliarcobacter cryaerophilus]|uniref:sensor histidine kinase n=1 Tax=Aliarcobacter cryaerophilus TaxID=28198 RepID=UPI0011DF7273|nr:sensor histidine kinase [Aliarcobacter cryaerophilus]
MKKLFIFFVTIIVTNMFANTIIKDNFSQQSLENSTKVYFDKNSDLSFEEIMTKEFTSLERSNFPTTKFTIWSYFNIFSTRDIEIFFENIKAGVDYIDVYILKDGKFFKKLELGDYRDIKNREIKTKNSAFSLNIKENSTYEFFIKYKSYSSISTVWEIYNKDKYEELLSFRSLVWGFFIGAIFVLAFHNLFIYFSTKEMAFLFYSLFIISSTFYQLHINGIFYEYFTNIDLNILSGLNLVIAFFTLLVTLLFNFFIIKPKKGTLSFNIIFLSIFFTTITLVYYMFGFKYPDIRYSVNYTNFVSFFAMFVLLFTSFLSYKNGETYLKWYFVILTIYIFTAFYVVCVLVGIFEYFANFWLFVPIFIFVDLSLFSIILYLKLKSIYRDKIDQEQFIVSQARFTSLGNNVANMIHQWKNPIAQIGSQVALLETTYHLDNKNYMQTSQNVIPHIKNSILFLRDTMNDIYNFYKNPLEKENFSIKEQLNTLLNILKNELELNSIKVNLDIEDIKIFGYKTSFLNSLMILLENSIYELKNFKDKDRRIVVVVERYFEGKIKITIEDNGRGIQKEHLNSIFDLNFSTKNSSGIGLALAKELVEKRFNGNIIVENTSNGTKFTILIKE